MVKHPKCLPMHFVFAKRALTEAVSPFLTSGWLKITVSTGKGSYGEEGNVLSVPTNAKLFCTLHKPELV